MCYQVITHYLSCDARPRVSDGITHFINPFDEPHVCNCPRIGSLPRPQQCEYHGCCRATVNLRKCDNVLRCGRPHHVHLYEQLKMIAHQRPVWPDSPRFTIQRTESNWDRVPGIDGVLFRSRSDEEQPLPSESTYFKQALAELLDKGKLLFHLEQKIHRITLDLHTLRNKHLPHRQCELLSRPSQCPQLQQIESTKRRYRELHDARALTMRQFHEMRIELHQLQKTSAGTREVGLLCSVEESENIETTIQEGLEGAEVALEESGKYLAWMNEDLMAQLMEDASKPSKT